MLESAIEEAADAVPGQRIDNNREPLDQTAVVVDRSEKKISDSGEEHLSDTSTLDLESIATKHKDTITDQMTAYERRRSGWLKYFLGDIYAEDDPSDMSDRRRNLIIFIVALGGVSGPLASMIVCIVSFNFYM